MFSLDINWRGLLLPFAYLAVLAGALMTFSTVYRKRKAAESASLKPWFGPHLQRNVYLSLLHMESSDSEKAPKVPDSVLRAALLRRAVENINRIIEIRNAKAALSSLLQRGSVGDDLWQRFQRADKEMEEELRDVVMEANALAPGANWGQTIFQSANEIAANTLLRKKLDEIQAQTEAEKEWWAKRRAAIQSDFMKELDGEAGNGGTARSETPHTKSSSAAARSGSEDDAVLVDATAEATPRTPASVSTKKKKGGKK